MDSILGYKMHNKIGISLIHYSGQSLITKARNTMLSDLYFNNNDYTHVFWQDSDVGLDHDAIIKLVDRNVDVIAVPVSLKLPLSNQGIAQSIGYVYEEVDNMLYKAHFASTSALMLSKKAITSLVEYCEKNKEFYFIDKHKEYLFFKSDLDEFGRCLSEDYWICKTLRQLGFPIYVDSSIGSIHFDNQRSFWYRGPMKISEYAFKDSYEKPLPEKLKKQRWTPNHEKIFQGILF
jgi:hypothetical protein